MRRPTVSNSALLVSRPSIYFCSVAESLLPRDATHSAVMPQKVVCLSVRPSVYDV